MGSWALWKGRFCDEPFIWKSGWPHLIVMQPVPAPSQHSRSWARIRVRSFDLPLGDFAPLTWILNMAGKEFVLTRVSVFRVPSEAGLLVGSALPSRCNSWGGALMLPLWDVIIKEYFCSNSCDGWIALNLEVLNHCHPVMGGIDGPPPQHSSHFGVRIPLF